jgi:hypothetical protein
MVETAPTPTPTPAEQPSFGSVFEEVTQKYSNERANEVMDLAVLHEDIFAKIPSSHDADVYNAAIATITPEENQILTDLVNTYGREAVVAARKVSRGMQHGDKARGSAEAKIKVLERMKRARGAGDTTDLDTRIAKLQSAVDRTENSEKTRNEIKRTQVQRAAYNEAKNVDPYDFWGMEDTTASRTNTTNLRPEITEALTSYETTLKATRETYANATAKARRSGVGRFLLGDQKICRESYAKERASF